MACNVPLLEAEQIPELKCTKIVMQRRESAKLQATSCFSGRYLEHVAGKPASQISLVDNNRMEYVATSNGDVLVTIQGDESCFPIITYHDIATNHETCFDGLFGLPDMVQLFHLFCWYHIDAPGQESSAQRFVDKNYPSMTELAEQVYAIVKHFNLNKFIGIAVGAGANILSRVAMMHPDRVAGLVLINLSPNALSWIDLEWLIHKIVCKHLRQDKLTTTAQQYLTKLAFSTNPSYVSKEMLEIFSGYLRCCDLYNTSLFIESYAKRSSIAEDMVEMLQCPCLFVMGTNSLHKDDVFQIASELGKLNSTVLQVESDGLILEDAVDRFFTGFKLFLQGLGHGEQKGKKFNNHAQDFSATGLGAVSPETSGSFIKAIQLQQSVLSNLD